MVLCRDKRCVVKEKASNNQKKTENNFFKHLDFGCRNVVMALVYGNSMQSTILRKYDDASMEVKCCELIEL